MSCNKTSTATVYTEAGGSNSIITKKYHNNWNILYWNIAIHGGYQLARKYLCKQIIENQHSTDSTSQ